ncbi:C-factor-like isoform X2 [Homarus americanus]|uniref:C-factor-like isoform X2 n=1 Tax=Homarus americanus TaxID=6706 RepID=UPI001C48EFB4|nr:C-factor-like isoform X2 [Homarus americanus]
MLRTVVLKLRLDIQWLQDDYSTGIGTTVVACCRNPSSAESLKNLQGQYPDLVDVVQLDVTDEAAIQRAAQHVHNVHASRLELLINCSGILSPTGRGETRLKDVTLKGLEETLAVNTLGPLMMAKHFSQHLMAGAGTIGHQTDDPKQHHAAVLVNMSARVGSIRDNELGGWYSYRMSKSALNMATKNLSIELGRGKRKVICVALHPGTVNTDLSRPYHKNVPEGSLFSPTHSVNYLLTIIDKLSITDTGKYYAWNGTEIPY